MPGNFFVVDLLFAWIGPEGTAAMARLPKIRGVHEIVGTRKTKRASVMGRMMATAHLDDGRDLFVGPEVLRPQRKGLVLFEK